VSLPHSQAGICYTIMFGRIRPRSPGVSPQHADLPGTPDYDGRRSVPHPPFRPRTHPDPRARIPSKEPRTPTTRQ